MSLNNKSPVLPFTASESIVKASSPAPTLTFALNVTPHNSSATLTPPPGSNNFKNVSGIKSA